MDGDTSGWVFRYWRTLLTGNANWDGAIFSGRGSAVRMDATAPTICSTDRFRRVRPLHLTAPSHIPCLFFISDNHRARTICT
jgi:hypothetical protein